MKRKLQQDIDKCTAQDDAEEFKKIIENHVLHEPDVFRKVLNRIITLRADRCFSIIFNNETMHGMLVKKEMNTLASVADYSNMPIFMKVLELHKKHAQEVLREEIKYALINVAYRANYEKLKILINELDDMDLSVEEKRIILVPTARAAFFSSPKLSGSEQLRESCMVEIMKSMPSNSIEALEKLSIPAKIRPEFMMEFNKINNYVSLIRSMENETNGSPKKSPHRTLI